MIFQINEFNDKNARVMTKLFFYFSFYFDRQKANIAFMSDTSSVSPKCFSGSIVGWVETMSYCDKGNYTECFISNHATKLHERAENLVIHFADTDGTKK